MKNEFLSETYPQVAKRNSCFEPFKTTFYPNHLTDSLTRIWYSYILEASTRTPYQFQLNRSNIFSQLEAIEAEKDDQNSRESIPSNAYAKS